MVPEQPAWPWGFYRPSADLRELAEQADAATFSTGGMPSLEECTRTVSKAFSICATDRTFRARRAAVMACTMSRVSA
jgi:hypothetical protein